MDPEFVASCAPGVLGVETVDATHFKVLSGFGVGSVKLRFDLDIELSDIQPPASARMAMRGKAPGSALHVDTAIELDAIDAHRTRLNWKASATIHGTVASVGARLLKGTTKKLTDSFWKKFAQKAGRAR